MKNKTNPRMSKDAQISNLILKNILLKELNEAEPMSQYNPDDNIQTPFEKDPMGFILKKYITLNEVLKELMTDSFQEYLNGIFIVAPKPTTFKILLHNGQFFFLTFLGKAYQATVQGKNYYLMTIGEKERCMQAIARILRHGSPLKTQGPEGAEQGTRPEGEEGGLEAGAGGGAENTGMEGDWAEKTGNVVPGTEAGGEEEETATVSEAFILQEALKKSILKEAQDLFDTLKKGLEDQKFKGKRESKRGKHLRYSIGNEKQALQALDSILKSKGVSGSYKIEVIPPNEFAKGGKSGKYPTFKVTVTKNTQDFKKGEEAFIVNQQTEKATIVAKSLTPTNLGLAGRTFKGHSALNSALKSALSSLENKKLSELLISLTDLVDREVKSKYKSVSDFKDYEETVSFDKRTNDLISEFSQQDINVIGKDYGEELGALAMLKSLKSPEKGVEFPKGNNPLADFFLDGYSISSKYEKGAAATLTAIVNGIDEKKLVNKEQKALFEMLKIAATNKVSQGYLEIAKSMKSPAIQVLSSIMKVSPDNITAQAINDFIVRLLNKAKNNQQKDALLMKTFSKFYDTIGRMPQNGKVDWDKLGSKKYYGPIIGPLSYHVADIMNKNPSYAKSLTELLSKIEVKQLYLVFSMSKRTMNFKLKSFTDPNAKFKFDIGSQSTYNPENSRLGFKLQ